MVASNQPTLPKLPLCDYHKQSISRFIKHHDEWHSGSFESILSPTLFEAVQKVLNTRKKPRKSKCYMVSCLLGFQSVANVEVYPAQYATNRFGTKYTYYRCR